MSPSLLTTVLLLQTHDKVSEAEAKARGDFDVLWMVASDTTFILGRGAVKDSYNLLEAGTVKLLRALAAVERSTVIP